MAEIPQTLFKSVLSAHQDYKNNKTDKSCLVLKQQFDLLRNMTASNQNLLDIDLFDITSAEMFASIIEVLAEPDDNIQIKYTVIDTVSNMIKNGQVLLIFRNNYPILSALSSCLINCVQYNEERILIQCLLLLDAVLFELEVKSDDSCVSSLLNFVISKIIDSPSSAMFESCINVLTNLCKNTIVQSHIKSMRDIKMLYKILLRQLPINNHAIAISSLSILTSLLLHDSLGKPLFGEHAIQKTFHLMMTILIKESTNYQILNEALNVISMIVDSEHHRELIVSLYSNMKPALKAIVETLQNLDQENCAEKILKLLSLLWNYNSTRELLMYSVSESCGCLYILKVTTQWILDPNINTCRVIVEALHFLRRIIEHLQTECKSNRQDVGVIEDLSTVVCTSLLKSNLDVKHPSTMAQTCEKLHKYLQLVIQLFKNCENHQVRIDSCTLTSEFFEKLLHWLLGNTSVDEVQIRSECLDTMFSLLSVINILCNHDENIRQLSLNLFETSEKLSAFLAAGLKSPHPDHVLHAITILPSVAHKYYDSLVQQIVRHNLSSLSDKCTGVRNVQSSRSSSLAFSSKSSVNDNCQDIDSVICNILNMKLTDPKTSEIIEIYEVKISQMKKELNHLQEILQSKLSDSRQLEQLNNQYRCNIAQGEVEMHAFRKILKDSERNKEIAKQQLLQERLQTKQLTEDVQSTQTMMKQLQCESQRQDEQLKHRLEGMQKRYENAQKEYKTLSERSIELQRNTDTLMQRIDELLVQVESLTMEKEVLRKECNEKEATVQEMTTQQTVLRDAKQNFEVENNNLSSAVEKFTDEINKIELKKNKLQQEVNEYEVLYKQAKDRTSDLENKIKELNTALKKEQEITKMIHSLTGNKLLS